MKIAEYAVRVVRDDRTYYYCPKHKRRQLWGQSSLMLWCPTCEHYYAIPD